MKESRTLRGDAAGGLERSYATTLERYLVGGGEGALHGAYQVGREAMASGRSLLEMAAMHHAALLAVLRRRPRSSLAQDLARAGEVFGETLSPYEMAHRGFRDAISALRQLNETLEREILRVAQAVHDEAGQLLVAARLAMSGVFQELDPSLQERMREVGALLDRAEKELRRISHELRPTILDELGLVPALEFLAGGVSRGSSLSVHVESSLEGRQAPNLETALYRIVQEALANVTKHSGARNVRIRLTRDGKSLRCLIRDDGVGFDVSAVRSRTERRGLGLAGMRERLNAVGGTLQINSEPGRGTELLVRVPMEG